MTPDRERELHRAALESLVEHGYDLFSMDDVATRARASKATLYRHWPDKQALLVEALHAAAPESPDEVPDTGSLRGDLHALIRSQSRRDDVETELLSAVLHACGRHPELARQLREQVIEPHLADLEAIFDRAVERGEIAADAPARRFVLLSLAAPRLLRPLLDGVPSDEQYLLDHVDHLVLPALLTR